ncbi:MAG: helix-turn-helix domain-containing protein [Herpetosiphon sp.]|nr:helix-turn-helix domain-containing protein [Herpetosiphon sp.]
MPPSDYSLEEAAALMNISEPMLQQWAEKELIGEYDEDRGWRIPAHDVYTFITVRHEQQQDYHSR